MEYRITKNQYDALVNKLLKSYLGAVSSVESESYYELFSGKEQSSNFADIWKRKKHEFGCKKELVFHFDTSSYLTRFVPVIKKKRFGKLLIDYIYKQTGILADCVDYDYDFKLEKKQDPTDSDYDADYDDFDYRSKNYSRKLIKKKRK